MGNKNNKKREKKYSGIGGQAVMEGIMMKNKDRYSVAVRRPDGEIEVMTEEYHSIGGNSSFAKLPFIRGVYTFVDSLVLGMKTLSWSASFYEDEEESKDRKDSNNTMIFAVILSIVFSVIIFMLTPYWMAEFLRRFIASDSVIAIIEGVFKLLIFVGYVSIISLMDDIKRVYMYHGAEHKCINCIEHGYELNVKNVMKASRQHSRCGTSFLMFVMLISIVLFMLIKTDSQILRVGIRLLLIPVIAGISYEIIRLAGKTDNIILNILSAPGMALQKITTREPDEEMVQVAIKAVEAVFDWRSYLKEIAGIDIVEESVEDLMHTTKDTEESEDDILEGMEIIDDGTNGDN